MNLNIRNKILGLSLLLLTGVSAMASPLTGQVPESESKHGNTAMYSLKWVTHKKKSTNEYKPF